MKFKLYHQTRQLYFMCLGTYQSAKIVESFSLKILRHLGREKIEVKLLKSKIYTNKELYLIEEPIHIFYKEHYIPDIEQVPIIYAQSLPES